MKPIFRSYVSFRMCNGCFLGFEKGNEKTQLHAHRIHGTGIFTYIWLIFKVHVGKYTIHGSYGHGDVLFLRENCDICQKRTSKVATIPR